MKIKGTITYFLEPNTDTDVIIPARFLKRTQLDGFNQFAFYEKKYTNDTVCEPSLEARDYVFSNKKLSVNCSLNHPNSKNANFLLTWNNFGCGSSREHAVYALKNYQVIIGSAPKNKSPFADIFRDNCRQNLIWTPVITHQDHAKLVQLIQSNIDKNSINIEMDVATKTISVANELSISFDIPDLHYNYITSGQEPFKKAKSEIQNALKKIKIWNSKNQNIISLSPISR